MKIRINTIGGIILLLLTLAWMFAGQETQTYGVVTPKEVYEMSISDTNLILLDVRTLEEFNGELGHVEGAILIPVQELDDRVEELAPYRTKTIIAICRSGNRSGRAAALLTEKGYTVRNMVGGMLRWNAEKLPVVRENQE